MKATQLNLTMATALALSTFFAYSAHAFDSRKCNKILNQGEWKTYKYQGVGEGQSSATSQGTRKEGSIRTSSESETESSTSSVDPGVTTKYSTSTGQYSSSFGECDSFALNKVREERDHFIALNSEELKKEIAVGHGEFLAVLDDYALCTDSSLPQMHSQLRKKFERIVNQSPTEMPKTIMSIIGSDSVLRTSCDTI